MSIVKFKTKIRNGKIKIPKTYLNRLSDMVNVILVSDEELQGKDVIAQLIDSPLKVVDFRPLERDKIHER